MRRVVVVAVIAATLALPAIAAAPGGAQADTNATRAIQAYVAMQRYLFDVRSGSYREAVGEAPGAHAWPISQAIAATIAVTQVPGANPGFARAAKRRIERLEDLRSGAVYTASAGGSVYYDDNEWIAEDLLDADAAWPDAAGRRRATEIFDAVVRAWDSDPSHPCAGGIVWTEAPSNKDRNTVTTANGALLGLRLHALAPRSRFLQWSQRMLSWLDRCMLASNGLYWDHIDASGVVDATHWSYNQGSIIGANVLLYRQTHDAAALVRAEGLADATLAYFAAPRLAGEPPEFAAIFFRNLLALAAIDKRQPYVDAAQAYVDQAWALRNARTNLVSSGKPARLLEQAAIVQIYSALATARP
jgi:type II secretory pathway pseudopilin PulG